MCRALNWTSTVKSIRAKNSTLTAHRWSVALKRNLCRDILMVKRSQSNERIISNINANKCNCRMASNRMHTYEYAGMGTIQPTEKARSRKCLQKFLFSFVIFAINACGKYKFRICATCFRSLLSSQRCILTRPCRRRNRHTHTHDRFAKRTPHQQTVLTTTMAKATATIKAGQTASAADTASPKT